MIYKTVIPGVEMLQQYKVSEINNIKINGRTTECLDPLTLFWTASGFELNARGSELWVEIEAGFDLHEPWFSVLINGAHVTRQMAYPGRNWVCLFRNMNQEEVKRVHFVKDVQAMNEDSGHYLQVLNFRFDGVFEPIEEKPYKIEFIGDSITSGEGTVGAKEESDWISMFFSGVTNYAAYTAEKLNAEFRIYSQSGWGLVSGWNNDPNWVLPPYYEKVCGFLKGEHNRMLGAFEDYDFTKWQPDMIVINLGTNDASAFVEPEWVDEVSGERFKQHLNEDGSFKMEDRERLEQTIIGFLYKLRKYHKNARIVWVYGMLGYLLTNPIVHAIDEYQQQSGDTNVEFLQLPATNKDTVGSREHPGVPSHKIAADIIFDFCKDKRIV